MLQIVGWLLACAVPAVIFQCTHHLLNWDEARFITIFSSALILWIFRLVPEFVPVLLILSGSLILGLAPDTTILSGFTSSGFFMALSIFGLGAVLIDSGLFNRITLIFLKYLPRRLSYLQGFVYLIGMLLSMVMTAQSARMNLIVPFSKNLGLISRLPKKHFWGLASYGYFGSILFSAMFLTGKSSNFVLYGMLPTQVQDNFTWIEWLNASAVCFGILFIGMFLILRGCYRTTLKLSIKRSEFKHQLKTLGPMRIEEWVALIAVLMLIIGLATSAFHHIQISWLALGILFLLLNLGFLSKNSFTTQINWPFLIYLGGFIGIIQTARFIGLDDLMAEHLSWILKLKHFNDFFEIITLYGLGLVVSLLFGTSASPALLFSILLPLSHQLEMNPWLIAFVLLMATESWIFPYQSSYYLCFEELAAPMNRRKTFFMANCASIALRLMALLSSIYYWRTLGFLGAL